MNNPQLGLVFTQAADVIRVNGHYQGDHLPDPFDREMCIPHFLRPMSIVAALRYAASGDPHRDSLLADAAISALALLLDGGPEWGDIFSLEAHVTDWGDNKGRTDADAIGALESAAAECSKAVAA